MNCMCSLMTISDMLSKHVGAVKGFKKRFKIKWHTISAFVGCVIISQTYKIYWERFWIMWIQAKFKETHYRTPRSSICVPWPVFQSYFRPFLKNTSTAVQVLWCGKFQDVSTVPAATCFLILNNVTVGFHAENTSPALFWLGHSSADCCINSG